MGECVRVPALHERCLFLGRLVHSVIHEHLPAHVCKRGVQSTGDKNAAIVESNRHCVALQSERLRHRLPRPGVLREVILQDQLWVVRVTEKVVFRDRLDLVVEELKGMFVGEVDDVVFQGADVFEELRRVFIAKVLG